jgi:hypothetical protein
VRKCRGVRMRLVQKRSVVFAGVMGLATGVLTGNSGLSPIIDVSRKPQAATRPTLLFTPLQLD